MSKPQLYGCPCIKCGIEDYYTVKGGNDLCGDCYKEKLLHDAAPAMKQALECVQNWIERGCPRYYNEYADPDQADVTIDEIIQHALDLSEGKS